MRNDIKLAFEQGKIQAICGFPGIGKSYLANKHPMQFQDCFYSKCRYFNRAISALEKPEYPMNWINRVKDAVKNGKIVVVGCNPDSRAILNSLGLNYLLVYPLSQINPVTFISMIQEMMKLIASILTRIDLIATLSIYRMRKYMKDLSKKSYLLDGLSVNTWNLCYTI